MSRSPAKGHAVVTEEIGWSFHRVMRRFFSGVLRLCLEQCLGHHNKAYEFAEKPCPRCQFGRPTLSNKRDCYDIDAKLDAI